MSWISENISTFFSELIGGAIDSLGQFVNNIYASILQFALGNVYYLNAVKFVQSMALLLIGVVVLNIIISGYIMETAYDSEEDPFNILIRIAQTAAVILNSNWIFNWFYKLGTDFSNDLIGAANAEGYSGKTRSLLAVDVSSMGTGFLWHVIMLCVVLISIIIFTIVAGLRAGELVAMNLLFPFFALDLLTNSRERWKNFFTAYLIAFFSHAIQLLFYIIAMKSYMSMTTGYDFYSITTIVFMIIAIKSPQFIEKFVYSSGLSNAASGGIRMLAQTALLRAGR